MIAWISIERAASEMGVSASWLRKLIKKVDISYFQEKSATRGRILISVDSLNKYFNNHKISAI